MSNLSIGGYKGITTENVRTQNNQPNPVPAQYFRRAKHPEYIDRAQRLFSFTFWRHSHIQDPAKLADLGFFYTGEDDLVRCYFCSLGLKDFIPTHDPLQEHVRCSENCEFLIQLLGPSRLQEIKENLHVKEKLQRETPATTATKRSISQPQASGFDLDRTFSFRHPEYSSFSVRLASYTGWPRSLVQTPQQLAEAGFYYTGTRDIVRCFSCDGGLVKWDPDDDPWIEHCANFPHCLFLKEVKGERFISLAISHRIRPKSLISVKPSVNQTNKSYNNYKYTIGDSVVAKVEEMGYSLSKTLRALEYLRKEGKGVTVEDVIDFIEKMTLSVEKKTTVQPQEDKSPELTEERRRLRQELICRCCKTSDINILFLPCQHHKLCADCSESITRCPVCDSHIDQKIKTFRQ